MEQIARVYADSLFDVALEKDKLDPIRDGLAGFADAVDGSRELQTFLFSPYFSSQEKREGIERVVDGAEPELANFLGLLAERHRMPALFRIRQRFDQRWAEENKRLEVTLTSAIELSEEVADRVRAEVERQTDRKVELRTEVDAEVLGGLVLRVGNKIVDASLRSKLERLRREVGTAA